MKSQSERGGHPDSMKNGERGLHQFIEVKRGRLNITKGSKGAELEAIRQKVNKHTDRLTYIHTHTYIHTYTHTYTYIHIYVHTHIYT